MMWIGALGLLFGLIGLVTAIIDMAMNGAGNARWTPIGLGIAVAGFGAKWLSGS